MNIKLFGRPALEKIAQEFLETHGLRDNRALRVETAIESFGYRIFSFPGLAEIAEAYVPVKPGYIFVDEEQYLGIDSFRWRFSLAEELAHILIHRPMFEGMTLEQIIEFQNEITDKEYLALEREAKYLAGCLLMPADEYKKRFVHFWDLQSSRIQNELTVLRYVVRQVSYDFNVSVHSVALRALNLELIDQQQFDDLMDSYSPS